MVTEKYEKLLTEFVTSECVLAIWLVNNPDFPVFHHGSYLVYDSDKKYFLYHKPTNKKRKGWYRARGMDSWLALALRRGI